MVDWNFAEMLGAVVGYRLRICELESVQRGGMDCWR